MLTSLSSFEFFFSVVDDVSRWWKDFFDVEYCVTDAHLWFLKYKVPRSKPVVIREGEHDIAVSSLVANPAEISEKENYSWPQLAFADNLDEGRENLI